MSSTLYRKRPQGNQFRLLEIVPGQWGDELVATLYMASERHRFTALSYTWGTSRRSQKIMVNDEIQFITFNLDCALRTLRSQHASIIMWVDSLCIDQTNADEKTQQVALMHNLFYWAEDVHAYLGDSLDRSHAQYNSLFKQLGAHSHVHLYGDSRDDQFIEQMMFKTWPAAEVMSALKGHQLNLYAFCLLAALSQTSWCKQINDEQILHPRPNSSNLSKALCFAKLRILFEHLRVFATSPWWDRIWIVQEAGVARQLRITYGKITISFEALERARSHLEILSIPPISSSDNMKVMSLLAAKITTLSKLRELRSNRLERVTQGMQPLPLQGQHGYITLSMGSPLLWLLRMFRNRRSSEPRDKVIALLQLRQDLGSFLNENVSPDYGSTVHHLFTHVSFTIMKTTGIFWVTTGDLLSKSRHDIPSWVPDWSNDTMAYDPHHLSWKLPLLFNTGGAPYSTASKKKTNAQDHCRQLLQNTRYALEINQPWRLALVWVKRYGLLARVEHSVEINASQALTTNYVSEVQRRRAPSFVGLVPQPALLTEGEFIDTISICFEALIPSFDNVSNVLMRMILRFADVPCDGRRPHRSFNVERPLLDQLGRVLCSGVFKDRTTRSEDASWYRIEPQSHQEFLVSCVALRMLGKGFTASSAGSDTRAKEALVSDLKVKNLFDLVFESKESHNRAEAVLLVFWPERCAFTVETASDVTNWGDDVVHHKNPPLHIFTLPAGEGGPPSAYLFHAQNVVLEVMGSMSSTCRPILTRRGFFGLAPLTVETGEDHIFAIPGATMPVVIKCNMYNEPEAVVEDTMQSSEITKKMAMTMVGTCYLDGFMEKTERYQFMGSTSLCLV